MADVEGSSSGWVLPEKYSKDLKDENGNPLSKSEFKKRQKAAEKAQKAAAKAAAKKDKPQPNKKKQVRKERKEKKGVCSAITFPHYEIRERWPTTTTNPLFCVCVCSLF